MEAITEALDQKTLSKEQVLAMLTKLIDDRSKGSTVQGHAKRVRCIILGLSENKEVSMIELALALASASFVSNGFKTKLIKWAKVEALSVPPGELLPVNRSK